jgi:hypothetical protein
MGRARSFHVITTSVAERQAAVNTAIAPATLIHRGSQRIVALTKGINISGKHRWFAVSVIAVKG